MNNKNLFYFIKFNFLGNDNDFQIVRIKTSWNKSLSVFYITVADCRNVFLKLNNINKLNSILDTLAQKWKSNLNPGKYLF